MSPIAHRLVRATASATLILGTLLAAPAGVALGDGPPPAAWAPSTTSDALRALPRPAPALAAEAVPTVVTAPAVAAPADYSNVAIGLRSVMSGLSGPVQVTNAGDGSGRLFVVEQRGVIKVWRAGHVLPTPFLDMRSKVVFNGERGLLALAFSPNYRHNHKFYVLYTERGTGDVILAEYKATSTTSNHASPGSFRRVLRVSHRVNSNHNGGMLAFGFAGLLYISIGDGGGAGDVPNNAQSRATRLGKILRIDVNRRSPGLAYRIPKTNPYSTSKVFRREIWSYGLRNPWRFSFDRANRDLWIGDVGQGSWEEVDHASAASGGGKGLNFGWHITEGNACYNPSSGCNMTGLTPPVAVYDHGQGCAIIGGYVYRGPQAILRGAYLFSDVCSGTIWSIVAAGPSGQTPTVMANTSLGITSFGEGQTGTTYVTAQNGHVYRLVAASR
jgi:glucose/arabinose dehydrogenase